MTRTKATLVRKIQATEIIRNEKEKPNKDQVEAGKASLELANMALEEGNLGSVIDALFSAGMFGNLTARTLARSLQKQHEKRRSAARMAADKALLKKTRSTLPDQIRECQ